MNRVFSICAALLVVVVLIFLVVRSDIGKTDTSSQPDSVAIRLADYKDYLKPVYIDFRKVGWEKNLYFADYSVGQDHFYRVNFEPASIKQSSDGLSLVISEADGEKNWGWDSAEVQVTHKTGYGRYEVVMKPAAGPGLISSFFTFTGPYFGDPQDEVDIEFLGKNLNEVEFNTYTSGKPSGGARYELGYNASEEFHLYAFDWQPGSVKFYIDGEFVHEISGAPEEMPKYAGKIMFNFWTGTMTDWHGEVGFEPGVSAHYQCIAYRPTGDSVSPLCAAKAE